MQPVTALIPVRVRFIDRSVTLLVASSVVVAMLSGCGNVLYTYRANSASTTLEEARQAGAEKSALYEYTLAREHLTKAMSEASEADYGDAHELAELADTYAAQALAKARRRLQSTKASEAQVPVTVTPTRPTESAGTTGAAIEFKGEQE